LLKPMALLIHQVIVAFVATALITVLAAAVNAIHPTLEAVRKSSLELPALFNTRFSAQRTLRWQSITQRLLDSLCDMQLITGAE
jgi:hypothetical protein